MTVDARVGSVAKIANAIHVQFEDAPIGRHLRTSPGQSLKPAGDGERHQNGERDRRTLIEFSSNPSFGEGLAIQLVGGRRHRVRSPAGGAIAVLATQPVYVPCCAA